MHLILNGGGIGEQVADARAKLNEVIDHNKRALYVPLAWPDPTYKGCIEFMTNELGDVDFKGIEMITTKEELVSKNFYDYAFIYIGGGNTFKLLKQLKESKSFDKIKEYLNNGGIVYGGSAGAIIFGKDLDSCKTDDLNEADLNDIQGFDMLNGYSLLCHYTNRDKERTNNTKEYLLELSKQKPIYAIPEEDTIYVNDEKIEVIGKRPYYIFKDGKIIEIKNNIGKQ